MYDYLNRNPEKVKLIQEQCFVKADGIFGKNTKRAYEENFGQFIRMGDKLIDVNTLGVKVYHGNCLYKNSYGEKNWSERKVSPDLITVHWGGLSTDHCYNVFENTKGRHVSSHLGVGRNKNGEIEIQQWLNLQLKAWHGGKINTRSIGIDICQHPTTKYFERTKNLGYDVEILENNNNYPRTPKQYVSVDKEVASVAENLIRLLRVHMNITHKPVCKDFEVYSAAQASQFSVIGHHNVSAKKWDVIPWAEDLYWSVGSSYS